MSKNHEEEGASFKVVDKRIAHSKDDEYLNARDEDNKTESKKVEEKKNSEQKIVSDEADKKTKIDFSMFVQSLAHQAMMSLGLVPWPDSGLIKKDLKIAAEMIEILTLLKDKTKNNLTKEEENLINGLVYQLQMVFVESANIKQNDKTIVT